MFNLGTNEMKCLGLPVINFFSSFNFNYYFQHYYLRTFPLLTLESLDSELTSRKSYLINVFFSLARNLDSLIKWLSSGTTRFWTMSARLYLLCASQKIKIHSAGHVAVNLGFLVTPDQTLYTKSSSPFKADQCRKLFLIGSDDMRCSGPLFFFNSNSSSKTAQCRSNHCFPEDIFLPRTNHYP